MDRHAAGCLRYNSGIIHRCLCRFWRSPIALNASYCLSLSTLRGRETPQNTLNLAPFGSVVALMERQSVCWVLETDPRCEASVSPSEHGGLFAFLGLRSALFRKVDNFLFFQVIRQ
jgi:hypothetical protein